eukprot:PITA_14589
MFSASTGTFKDKNVWVIDSGSSSHMMGECSQLQTLFKGISSHSIELGDNKCYPVKAIGSTSLELQSGGNIHLNNILYVAGLKKKLLSISCLEDKGNRVSFVDGKVLVWDKGSNINEARVIGVCKGTLYRLYTPLAQALFHLEVSPFELWHRRYGHLHYKIVPSMSQMVNGFPEIKDDREGTCKGCTLGKNVKKPFASSETRSQEILDLIHSDVCGPMLVKSLGGHQYYVNFIDDYSRKTWLYLLKNKDEVFKKFLEFKNEVEYLTEKKIKILRSDNGGEYTSKESIAFCKEAGIERELIVPYNLEQNGVTERKNRTIKERVRAMLQDQDIPQSLWGEARTTIVYLQNRSAHKILNNMTLEKAFIWKEANASSKAYIIYIKDDRRIEVSKDVIFDKNIAYKESKDVPVDSDEEEVPIFEDISRDNDSQELRPTQKDVKGTYELIQQVIVPENRKRPVWLKTILQEVKGHIASRTSKESKRPKRYSGYVAYIKKLIDVEHSSHEDAAKNQEWRSSMQEE